MMYPRLFLARQLLDESGAIFISIDDHEVYNLRMLMNEVFGEENFVTQIEWQKRYTRSNNTDDFTSVIDHLLVYAKSSVFAPRLLGRNETADSRYSNPDNDPRGPWKLIPFLNPLSPEQRPNLCYEIVNPNTGERLTPIKKAWRSGKTVYERYQAQNRIWWGKDGKSSAPGVKRFLSEVRQGMTPTNFWDYQFAGHTDQANSEIKELFGDKVFDTPKPVQLLKRMLQVATQEDTADIVLDFFAGSATIAEAILQQNQEDSGNRRYIAIQLPEPCPEDSPAKKAGFSTIAEIGKERIRRVILRMKANDKEQPEIDNIRDAEDLGFRVLKLSPSHFKPWVGVKNLAPEQYTEQMAMYNDPLVDGWTAEAVVQEVALKEGCGLGCRVEKVAEVTSQTLYRVTDPDREQSFTICLDDQITLNGLKPLHLAKDDLFVCRDSALDDEAAANLALQCRLKTI